MIVCAHTGTAVFHATPSRRGTTRERGHQQRRHTVGLVQAAPAVRPPVADLLRQDTGPSTQRTHERNIRQRGRRMLNHFY